KVRRSRRERLVEIHRPVPVRRKHRVTERAHADPAALEKLAARQKKVLGVGAVVRHRGKDVGGDAADSRSQPKAAAGRGEAPISSVRDRGARRTLPE
ncbi:MAG: hypothetical protein RLZZ221_1042, partial [Verrucomicrobiota bacterium]